MDPLRIFIGYDSKEPIAYHVLAHSIITRSSGPVTIMPLVQPALRTAGLYTRERGTTESTEFSMTRFLVPHLAGYKGDAIFMDCDMLCLGDIYELVAHVQKDRWERTKVRALAGTAGQRAGPEGQAAAVYVCQHEYQPTATVKFLGQVNVPYPRKNWSSLMYFDCTRCTALTPARVNILSGLELHRFSWLEDGQVGALPLEWNWLVGEYGTNLAVKNLHYTLGGPWFAEYAQCDYSPNWISEYAALCTPSVELPVTLARAA